MARYRPAVGGYRCSLADTYTEILERFNMSLVQPFLSEREIAYKMGYRAVKTAGDAEVSLGLGGRLYASKSGWILLSVPNDVVKGLFASLQEQGVELPPSPNGVLNAHISVMRKDELNGIGGPDRITERGKIFRYTTGRIKTCVPDGWDGMSRVWFLEVYSPELQNLRKSYGLSPLPKYPFHITIGVRRKNVLRDNSIAKA